MTFRCDPDTLERLEWPSLLERLAACASTARGAAACREGAFAETRAAVAERLAETAEARGLLDQGESPPFGGVSDLRGPCEQLERGAALTPPDALGVLDTLRAARRLESFLSSRRDRVGRLAELVGTLPDLRGLEDAIAKVVSPEGELREDATPRLAEASRRMRQHRAEIERRMNALLRDASIAPHLQDGYFTYRENRPVLPIRAEARRQVRGLVHDVSSSGTTLFIEPEPVVDLSNRLRVAESERQREAERILRELSDRLRAEGAALEATGATLERLDVICARARLSERTDAAAPEVGTSAPLRLLQLRHPLLLLEGSLEPEDVVPNDVALPEGVRGLVISGPNAGGKTAIAKAIGLAALAVRAGMHAPCAQGSALPVFDGIAADIGDAQDLRAGLSTFSARMSNLARIVRDADERTLVVLDEVGEGTEPGEGAALAQAALEALVERGATVVATTHFNRLKELAGHDPRFANASAEFDSETLAPTYRVRIGAPGSSGAAWVAERMGLGRDVVGRALELLDGEDRKLEALTRNLSELRQELESERSLAARLREETEERRDELEARLESLRSAREQALSALKAELETAYRSAREEIAAVVRQVQGGGRPDGRVANRAQQRLSRIRERTGEVEQRHAEPPRPTAPVDWGAVPKGSHLRLRGLPGHAVLLSAPDRRGRIEVRLGGARLTIDGDRVVEVASPEPAAHASGRRGHRGRVEVEREPSEPTASEVCDLRGMRVDEALDRAEAHLHRLLGTGGARITFIHGHGTGALRNAIRDWLRHLPEVADYTPGVAREGGNGVTVATLAH